MADYMHDLSNKQKEKETSKAARRRKGRHAFCITNLMFTASK